jgi:hypothetical protein
MFPMSFGTPRSMAQIIGHVLCVMRHCPPSRCLGTSTVLSHAGKQEPKYAARATLHEGTKRAAAVPRRPSPADSVARPALSIGSISSLHQIGEQAPGIEARAAPGGPQLAATASWPLKSPGLARARSDGDVATGQLMRPGRLPSIEGAGATIGPPRPPSFERVHETTGDVVGPAPPPGLERESSGEHANIGPSRPPLVAVEAEEGGAATIGPPRPASMEAIVIAGHSSGLVDGPQISGERAARPGGRGTMGPPRPRVVEGTPGPEVSLVGPPRPAERVEQGGGVEGTASASARHEEELLEGQLARLPLSNEVRLLHASCCVRHVPDLSRYSNIF